MEKRIIILLIILAITFNTLPILATPYLNLSNIVPYIGLDAQWRYMDFQKGFGQNLVKPNYPQGNIYLGIKFNPYVGIDAGYERTISKTRRTTLLGGDTWFKKIIDDTFPNRFNIFDTTTKIKGPHINIIGFLPINDHLELIGSIGIARLKIQITNVQSMMANITLVPPDSFEFVKSKWISRINLGAQYKLTDQFGIRATGGWESTAGMKDITLTSSTLPPLLTPEGLVAKLKNSINFGFGLFYNFK